MTRPSRIRVGTLSYSVTSTKPAIDAACRDEGENLWGRTDHGKLAIVIDPAIHPTRQPEVLLHEALHCLTERAGIQSELGATAEEQLVNRLAPHLLDLIRANPALVAYLQG